MAAAAEMDQETAAAPVDPYLPAASGNKLLDNLIQKDKSEHKSCGNHHGTPESPRRFICLIQLSESVFRDFYIQEDSNSRRKYIQQQLNRPVFQLILKTLYLHSILLLLRVLYMSASCLKPLLKKEAEP